ncbi:MAG: ATP-binding protein [Parcubacteria group bacterium]
MRWRTSKLAGKIGQWVLLVLIIGPVLIGGSMNLGLTYGQLTEHIESTRTSVTQLAAQDLATRFQLLEDLAVSFAGRVQFRQKIEQGDWQAAIDILKSVPDTFAYIDRVFISDPKGTLQADTPALPGVRGKNFAFRDWYQGVSSTQQPYLSDVYTRTAQPQIEVVAVAVPITSEAEKLLGFLVIQIPTSSFIEWRSNISIGTHTAVYFVDSAGQAIGDPDIKTDGADRTQYLSTQRVLKGEVGLMEMTNPATSENVVISYAPVGAFDWGAVIEQDHAIFYSACNNSLLITSALIGLVLAVLLLLWRLVVRTLASLDTERRRANTFLHSIGDGVAAIDNSWKIILWNTAAQRITGWSAREAVGHDLRSFLKLVRERDRSPNYDFIAQTMARRTTQTLENNTFLIKKDSSEIHVGDSAAPIIDERGRLKGTIIVFRDRTQEYEAGQIRSGFAYASHQLRTPITKALWNLELVLDEISEAKTRSKITLAHEALQSSVKVVDELIEVVKIDQGNLVVSSVLLKPRSVVESAVSKLKALIAQRKAKVRIEEQKTGSLTTDKRLLEKILSEIIENAIMYSPVGAEVLVYINQTNHDTVFEIRDQGLGIEEQEQPLIFTKFFRSTKQDTTAVSGAGLGLYIARAYTQLLKGKIWFNSTPKRGTTFFIRLPSLGV